MTFPFIQENSSARYRLETFFRNLSDEDLGRTNPDGWTVAALLAHLAFWDNRVVVLLRRWKVEGVDESPVDSDMTNNALKPLCLAIEPRTAVQLCLSSAEAADAEVEMATAELVKQIEASPNFFRLNRALHRNDHLNEIERLLGRK